MSLSLLAERNPIEVVTHFFTSGGFFMLPLLICSLISVTFILLRAKALLRNAVLPASLQEAVDRFRPGEPVDRLRRLTAEDESALARVVDVALQHRNGTKTEAVEAVQIRARHELVRLESGLVVLEVIIGIAPLLGLLGTVSGLVSVFAHLGEANAAPDPRGIAMGIAEALNTTIAGLAIAIPSLIGHSYFSKKIEVMAVEMEAIVAALLEKLFRSGRHGAADQAIDQGMDVDSDGAASVEPQPRSPSAWTSGTGQTEGAPAAATGLGRTFAPQPSTEPATDVEIGAPPSADTPQPPVDPTLSGMCPDGDGVPDEPPLETLPLFREPPIGEVGPEPSPPEHPPEETPGKP